jgi:GNAT superfamily N-acetyltransferase
VSHNSRPPAGCAGTCGTDPHDGDWTTGRRPRQQGKGLGSALLKDALLRTLNAASIVGIRAVLLHAISNEAKRFYEKAGFSVSPVDPMTMMITLADVEKALGRL